MIHAQERALQRYNKDLSDKDIECICQIIIHNEHIPLKCTLESKSKKFCYLKYNHIPYKVLYKNGKKIKIITIYPFDPDEYNNIEKEKKERKIKSAIALLRREGYKVEFIKGSKTGTSTITSNT